jgi:hypothetical protein
MESHDMASVIWQALPAAVPAAAASIHAAAPPAVAAAEGLSDSARHVLGDLFYS